MGAMSPVNKLIENLNPATVTSRRRFLGVLSVGVAGIAVVAALVPFGKRTPKAEAANEFPGPGSIFHPAQDPRTDPRR